MFRLVLCPLGIPVARSTAFNIYVESRQSQLSFSTSASVFPGPFKVGAAGVDLFFVISGFVMWVTTAGRNLMPHQFMLRRIKRIVPLYSIVTGVTAAAILLKPQFMYGHELSVDNFIRSLLFVPTVKNGGFHPVMIQGWTLVYEMFFYLVFAAALIARERRRLYIVAAVLGLLVLLQPIMIDGPMRALGNPIIIEFVAGMVLGRLWMSNLKPPLWSGALLLIAGLVLFALIENLAPQLSRPVRWGVPAAMVVAGSVCAERARPIPSIYFFKILGDASYSIYLWHVVVAALLQGVLLHASLPLALYIGLVCVLTIAFTILLYFLIEKPISDYLHPTPLQVAGWRAPHKPSLLRKS